MMTGVIQEEQNIRSRKVLLLRKFLGENNSFQISSSFIRSLGEERVVAGHYSNESYCVLKAFKGNELTDCAQRPCPLVLGFLSP